MKVPDLNATIEVRSASWEEDRELLSSIRHTVFVEEQNVPPKIEIDSLDPQSYHVLAWDCEEDRPVGTGRLTPQGRIGRVAVLKERRKCGVGAQLMKLLLKEARERGHREVIIHAQTWTIGFYETLGFKREGKEFYEAGIAHYKMRKLFHIS